MKKVAITQPYLFPYIGYFQIMNAVDEYVVYDDVQYIVRGWINRNFIRVDGEKKLFTIALQGASPNKLINEIEIADDFSKFQKTVAQAYAKAPYKAAVLELLADICAYEDRNLARFIDNSFSRLAAYLDIPTPRRYSSDVPKDNDLKGQDKILAICQALGAEQYINAIGGQELYDRAAFSATDIDLKFLQTRFLEYDQQSAGFEPGLSIIDVMMHNNPAHIKEMLEAYELI